MYDYLTGRLVEHGPDEVVVDLAGVGYRLAVSGATSGRLPERGATVTLHVHHLVRDDRPVLYGFASREERALFERLLGVSKVGPVMALCLLSALEPGALVAAIDAGDVTTLSRVRGVGRRTAERLCVELKGRLDAGLALPGRLTDRGSAVAAALVALGYPRSAARVAGAEVATDAEPGVSLEELVKRGLARVGSRGVSATAAPGPPA